MLHSPRNNTKLISRNEGKLKSYDSCIDVRAWSHDVDKRYSYLRDWIKSDMAVCVIPVCTVASFIQSMTCKRRKRFIPECRPECRSKVMLDSIYTSCHAIKECIKQQGDFDDFIEDEEFETSHWPCDKCFEILKSIKLFWKVLLEKLFNISLVNNINFDTLEIGSIHRITKKWQNEIVQQAIFVKNTIPNHHFGPFEHHQDVSNDIYPLKKSKVLKKDKSVDTKSLTRPYKMKSAMTFYELPYEKVQNIDVACDTQDMSDDIQNDYCLQQKIDMHKNKLRWMKHENLSMKVKLKNTNKINENPSVYDSSIIMPDPCNAVLKPFEACYDEESEYIKNIKSEMIITLKNCENKDFRHISVLQVLHKSNGVFLKENTSGLHRCHDRDSPLGILTRVHDTFGAIVRREISIAQCNDNTSATDISTSFYQSNINKPIS